MDPKSIVETAVTETTEDSNIAPLIVAGVVVTGLVIGATIVVKRWRKRKSEFVEATVETEDETPRPKKTVPAKVTADK